MRAIGGRPARAAAAAAAASATAGAVAITIAVANDPALRLTGYVSEAGTRSAGHPTAYRWGMLGLAAALTLLAAALPPAPDTVDDHPPGRLAAARLAAGRIAGGRLAAVLLGVAAAATAVSASVACSDGCPLPPDERTTGADLIHATASVGAVAACVLAILVVAGWPEPSPPRSTARATAVLALPLSAAVGLAMAAVGNGTLTGILERSLLTVTTGWLIWTSLRLAHHPPTGRN